MTTYPLTWPEGWKRTRPHDRTRAKFGRRETRGHESTYSVKTSLTIAQARERLLEELRRLGVSESHIILSTNLRVRNDGLPKSGQREPVDPGVAVYWKKSQDPQHKSIAIDQYDRVADNLAALAATIFSMRSIERHGNAQILDRVFTGFTALPSPNNWRHVFGFEDTPLWEEVQERYPMLAKQRHPDAGGSEEAMSQLNRARDDAKRELVG